MKRAMNRKEAGFTIIETIIVLALAGMILFLVLRAIPTLQRNGRNNQRQQDVQVILQAVSHYEVNNSGKFPDACGATAARACSNVEAGHPNDYFLRFVKEQLTFYVDGAHSTAKLVRLIPETRPTNITNYGGLANPDLVVIENYRRCLPANDGSTTTQGAGYNSVVAMYTIETNNGTSSQCKQL